MKQDGSQSSLTLHIKLSKRKCFKLINDQLLFPGKQTLPQEQWNMISRLPMSFRSTQESRGKCKLGPPTQV